jgi:hypothetical protein
LLEISLNWKTQLQRSISAERQHFMTHSCLPNCNFAGRVYTGIIIYPIGIFDENDRDRNPKVLSNLAEITGGLAFFPGEVSEIKGICSKISKEIRTKYTLGFPGAEDGGFHRIRITATDPRYGPLEVHSRNGYIAVGSSNANRHK